MTATATPDGSTEGREAGREGRKKERKKKKDELWMDCTCQNAADTAPNVTLASSSPDHLGTNVGFDKGGKI